MMNLWKTSFKPMLLNEIDKPFSSEEYIYELKFDGNRCLIYVSPKSFKIFSRHEKDITYLYPELKELQKLVKTKTIFDGEIVCTLNGFPSFSKLQERSHLKNLNKIKNAAISNPVIFMAFDILYLDKDLLNLDLMERKKILNQFLDTDYFMKVRYIKKEGIKLFEQIKKMKLEGIVAKRKISIYEINRRSFDWLKIKNFKKELFYIGGYSLKKQSHVFSIYLGEYIDNKLMFVGKAFVSKKNALFFDLQQIKTSSSPFFKKISENVCYVNPKYTCFIKYMERTKNNHLRQPFYIGK